MKTAIKVEGQCYVWKGALFRSGYGRISAGDNKHRAHRVIWEAVHGPISRGMQVLHNCDNPRCIRVDHLRLGTHKDNMHDMSMKKRAPGRPGAREAQFFCKRGHIYGPARKYKGCQTCENVMQRIRRQRGGK